MESRHGRPSGMKLQVPEGSMATSNTSKLSTREILAEAGFVSPREKGEDLNTRYVTGKELEKILFQARQYEKNLKAAIQSKKVSVDSALIEFPPNDVLVYSIPREISTVKNPVLAYDDIVKCNPNNVVKDCLDVYLSDWNVVEFVSAGMNGGRLPPPGTTANVPQPLPDKEGPDTEVGPLSPMFMVEELVADDKWDDKGQRAANRGKYMCGRSNMFDYYSVLRVGPEQHPSDPRNFGQPYDVAAPSYVHVRVARMEPAIGLVEPLFASLVVMDVARAVAVTEQFHFHVADSTLLGMMGVSPANVDPLMACTSAVFSFTSPSPNLVLVLRLEKIIKGAEVDEVVGQYLKTNLKPKEKEKLVKDMQEPLQRLSKYTQPLAWGYVPLCDGESIVRGNSLSVNMHKPKSYDLSDGELCDAINKLMKKKDSIDKKGFPGTFLLDIEELDDMESLEGCHDPSLIPLNPTGKTIIQQKMELGGDKDTLAPHIDYINNLYIYPESVNLTKHKASAENSRNIALSVAYKTDDLDPRAPGQTVVYGTRPGPAFVPEQTCAVTYHKQTPTFYDEVKVRLPANLSEHHHILIALHHVTCQKTKSNTAEVHPLGFAALRVLEAGGAALQDGPRSLPVATMFAPNYLSPDVEPHLKFVDHRKQVLQLRTRLVSSVYCQDAVINRFFAIYNSIMDGKLAGQEAALLQCLKELQCNEADTVLHFFPVLLNQLMTLLCAVPPAVAPHALSAFVRICKVVTDLGGTLATPCHEARSRLLGTYIHYQFNPKPRGHVEMKYQPFEVIVSTINVIRQAHQQLLPEIYKFSWVLFDLAIKSMALHLNDAKMLDDNLNRPARFPPAFVEEVHKLVTGVAADLQGSHVSVWLNVNMSFFIKDLFNLMDRGEVCTCVYNYLMSLPASSHVFRLAALRIICGHEHFVQLNLPLPPGDIVTARDIIPQFWRQYFLVGLLLQLLGEYTQQGPAEARLRALSILRDVLWQLDWDDRFAAPSCKAVAAAMFLPFLLITIDSCDSIQSAEAAEQADWLVCLLFVSRHMDRALLRSWWRADTQKAHVRYLRLLGLAVRIFQSSHMRREVSLTVLDIAEDFLDDFHNEINFEGSELLEAIYPVLMGLLVDQCASTLVVIFMSIGRFIHNFKTVLFKSRNTSYCGDLTYHLLSYANAHNILVCAMAGSLLFLMIKTNYTIKENFNRMRLQCLVAVSKLSGEEVANFKPLHATLEELTKLARQALPCGADVLTLTGRLFKIVSDSQRIRQYEYDPEMTADLLFQVSFDYLDSPDLRIAWLENLATFHSKERNFEELSYCKMYIASLVSEYLVNAYLHQKKGKRAETSKGGARIVRRGDPVQPTEQQVKEWLDELTGIPKSRADFLSLCPSITTEPPLAEEFDLAKGEEEGLYNQKVFSENGLLSFLKQAIYFYKVGHMYESCIDAYQMVVEVHQSHRDYEQMGAAFKDLKVITETLVQANTTNSRMFSNYYRVGFYGEPWSELNGKEFVYKEPPEVRLADFVERLKQQFGKKFSAGQLKILPNTPVEEQAVDPKMCNLQVVSVAEYFTEEEQRARKTKWQLRFNCQRYIFETPFTKGGKAHGDLTEQYKRKTILTTETPYPAAKKRLQVVRKEEVVVTPIVNAIEMVSSKVNALKNDLNTSPVNKKSLQINLQGAVLAQVNAGPAAIANIFLANGAHRKWPAVHVAHLSEVLGEFLKTCLFALRLNANIIDSDQLEFQSECDNSYKRIKEEINGVVAGLKV